MKCKNHPKRDAVALINESKKGYGCYFDYQIGVCKECLEDWLE